ncbi:flagellin [Marinobacterium sp. xm-a-152]|uniref:flagellin N-terminal helical domain-containing protein n=1 Tax=Marinobacterium sp. xm-a-152 TaxID=2497733 RepID=UPI001569D8AC|nr:flagellin [Marinobacterium sp. xm-a-152]NRP14422.1 A-type flagellin [Marinobacterium sp. xm-a-152]
MSMVINTNVASLASQRHLASSRADMEQAMERLSSGKRINSAGDDAAGLSISHKLDGKIASLNQAVRNANDGVAMINLAEGAMEEISSMLTRMKELATQAANGTYESADLTNLDAEYSQLKSEITRIAKSTDFNGVSVLNSTASATFQIGDGSTSNVDNVSVTMQAMKASDIGGAADTINASASITIDQEFDGTTAQEYDFALTAATDIDAGRELVVTVNGTQFRQAFVDADGTGAKSADNDTATINALSDKIEAAVSDLSVTESAAGVVTFLSTDATVQFDLSNVQVVTAGGSLDGSSISSASNASTALGSIDAAMTSVDSYRSTLGAVANRLDHAASNIMSRVEHQSAARSRIEDADYAVESANLAKAQVLQQAGTAMLSQANASTQNVLSLLK